ncbi:MAG: hypothetical protein P9F19_02015 [Candidatus Contendobacter sp.]|nr:hypothetical protein [Candidatus Contendobacter sp.]MDG4556166.1 hypothetical protein [Candidatus Contendobacter sp.]
MNSDNELERRADYPDILSELRDIRAEQKRQWEKLQGHIRETQEITDLWLHSRWLLRTLQFIAALAAGLLGGWLLLKQVLGGHS